MNTERKEFKLRILLLVIEAIVFILLFAFLATFFAHNHKEKRPAATPQFVMEWDNKQNFPERRLSHFLCSLILDASLRYQLDPALIAAVIERESGFEPAATAPDGGQGLMQLMPDVSRSRKCNNPYDPAGNIKGGAAHLSRMMKIFSTLPEPERTAFALAAYNGGPGHVFDARKIARKLKLNPDRWKGNVAETIQFLNHPEYYSKAEHGRCDGIAIAAYVECVSALKERFLAEFQNMNLKSFLNSY